MLHRADAFVNRDYWRDLFETLGSCNSEYSADSRLLLFLGDEMKT